MMSELICLAEEEPGYARLREAEDALLRAETVTQRAQSLVGDGQARLAARVTVLEHLLSVLLEQLATAGRIDTGAVCLELAEALEHRTAGIEARFGGRIR
jgi:hypothetical protein